MRLIREGFKKSDFHHFFFGGGGGQRAPIITRHGNDLFHERFWNLKIVENMHLAERVKLGHALEMIMVAAT